MKKIVFLTGAGISAESGIPTFRDEVTGLWENHRVEEVATAEAIKNNPELVYNFINQLRFKYKDCVPNLAHYDIAELEKKYEVVVITQNVDTLHEQAGSTNVIHLHGNLNEVRTVDDDNLIFTYPYEGITNEKGGKNTHKKNWINFLKSKGLKPVIKVLDEVSINEWKFWEKWWYQVLKS